jgi:hypothetical protein
MKLAVDEELLLVAAEPPEQVFDRAVVAVLFAFVEIEAVHQAGDGPDLLLALLGGGGIARCSRPVLEGGGVYFGGDFIRGDPFGPGVAADRGDDAPHQQQNQQGLEEDSVALHRRGDRSRDGAGRKGEGRNGRLSRFRLKIGTAEKRE